MSQPPPRLVSTLPNLMCDECRAALFRGEATIPPCCARCEAMVARVPRTRLAVELEVMGTLDAAELEQLHQALDVTLRDRWLGLTGGASRRVATVRAVVIVASDGDRGQR